MQAIASYVPPAFLAMFNMPPGFLEQANLAGFLSLGFTHPVYHLLSAATVIWFVTRNLTGDMESGAIQIALSRPVQRWNVFAARALGMLVISLLVPVLGALGMIAGIQVGRPDGNVEYRNFAVIALASFMLLACIGGITLLIAARADRTGQAVGWAIGFLVVSFVIDYFAQLWSALEPLDPFSIFNYFEPIPALGRGTIDTTNIVVLASISLLGMIAGTLVFSRRDLP